MRVDSVAARALVHEVLRRGDLEDGVRRLIESCRAQEPELPVWEELSVEVYVRDAEQVRDQLEVILASGAVPAEVTGFYFGLHADGISKGLGIGFGCTTRWEPSVGDCEWACTCDLRPGVLHSEILVQLYRAIRVASWHDLVLCCGFLGLALRRAFETLPVKLLLGGARERGVCWGFDEGDLYPLGRVRSEGFVLELEHPVRAAARPRARARLHPAVHPEDRDRESFRAHLAAGELEAAERLLEKHPYWASIRLAEAQREAGRRREFWRTLELFHRGSGDERSDFANANRYLHRCAEAIEFLDRLREREAADELLESSKRFLARAADESFVDAWVKTGAYVKFAEILERRGDRAAAKRARESAERWAERQSLARGTQDSANLAWRTIAVAWDQAGDLPAALRCAERIPNRTERLCTKAALFVRRGQDERVAELLDTCSSAAARAELEQVVAWEQERRTKR